MSKSCPYCAQTNTQKDSFGYCKIHNCFSVSGTKAKYEKLKSDLAKARTLPTNVRNRFDGGYYNPREIEVEWISKKIVELLGFFPMECTDGFVQHGNVSIGRM